MGTEIGVGKRCVGRAGTLAEEMVVVGLLGGRALELELGKAVLRGGWSLGIGLAAGKLKRG